MTEEEYLLKLVAIGSGNVGKTSIIRRYAEGKFTRNYLPTLGVDITTKKINLDNKNIKLILVDTAGQEFFGKLRPNYYKGASGCLIMFALTDRKSFDEVPKWFKEFRKHVDNPAIVLAGNKTDLEDERVVTREEAQAIAEQENVTYYETSALLGGESIDQIFLDLTGHILEKRK